MTEVKNINLHGCLKEKFGGTFKLAVKTPIEAIKALCHIVPGFRKEFEKHDYKIVKGSLKKGWYLDDTTVQMQLGEKDIHFIPVVAGSGGGGGLGKIIGGIILIGLAFTGVGAALGASIGMSVAQMKLIGGILVIGGLANSQAKTPDFQMQRMEPAERRPSFVFNGPQNTTEQGNAVPVIYGLMRVGSQVVSSGQDTDQI
jgi:predicted phage tail protein